MSGVANGKRRRVRRKEDGLANVRMVPAEVARKVLAQFHRTDGISPETTGLIRTSRRQRMA